jgi:hypothetical protein
MSLEQSGTWACQSITPAMAPCKQRTLICSSRNTFPHFRFAGFPCPFLLDAPYNQGQGAMACAVQPQRHFAYRSTASSRSPDGTFPVKPYWSLAALVMLVPSLQAVADRSAYAGQSSTLPAAAVSSRRSRSLAQVWLDAAGMAVPGQPPSDIPL